MHNGHCIYAVAGKGGTGKSTTAGLLVKYLVAASHVPILAIDADPSNCLGDVLGMRVDATLGGIREDVLKTPGAIPMGMLKQEYIDYQMQTAIVESPQIDLLTMGRPEGPGCYCFVNNILRNCIDTLSVKYPSVVIDCEAGIEHLSRRTAANVDYLFLITDVSVKGVKTIQVILQMIAQLKNDVRHKVLVFNKMAGEQDHQRIQELSGLLPEQEFKAVGYLPADPAICDYEMRGESMLHIPDQTPVYTSFLKLMKKV